MHAPLTAALKRGVKPYVVFPSRAVVFASILVSFAYFIGSKVGFAFTVGSHPVSIMWPPNAILLAALLLTPASSWGMILLAVLPAHIAVEWGSGVPLAMTLCWFVSNAFEAIVGAATTRFFVRQSLSFDRLQCMYVFFLCGVLLAPVVSSFLDAALVQLNHWGKDTYWEIWRIRTCSNIFACATFGVAIVTWGAAGPIAKLPTDRIVEAVLLVLGLASVVGLVVLRPVIEPGHMEGLWLYVPWPILLWAALRFGTRGASAALLITSIVTIWSVAHAHRPFLKADEQTVRSIQMFFVVMSFTLMPLASVLKEREKVEQDLRASEERYRGIVETQSDLACRFFSDTTLSFVNEAYCRFFQRDRKDLVGRRFLDLVPAAAHEYVLLSIEAVIRDRRTLVCEHEILLPGGGVGWHQWINQPIFTETGQIKEIQAIGRDVTARRRAETALRDNRERIHAILRAIPDSILMMDKSGVVLDCHTQDESLLLLPAAQSVGTQVSKVLIAELAQGLQYCFEPAFQAGRMSATQRALVIGGENRWFETRVVRCGSDKLLGLIRDITEQKHVEEELRQGEERYKEVVESQTELVSRYRPDMTLTFANEAYCRFFGRPRSDLVGNKLLDFFPAVMHPKVLRCMADVIAGRRLAVWEHLLKSPDGKARWVQWTNYAIADSSGQVKEIQGIGKDITDRKRAEEARQNLIHVSRLAVVGEFTATIAHEITQPLNAILTNTEAARNLLDKKPAPVSDLRAILSDICQDIMRSRETIISMRALSQRRALEMHQLDINHLVEEVVHLAGGDASRRHVQVRTELGFDLPKARGDPIHIQHILLNLILNGMDAMNDVPEGERQLTITTESRAGRELVVGVKDAGHGIPPEVMPRMFKSFFSTKPSGMGLGLSIARTIVNAHGGHIWVENNPDRGVTFRFTLPLAA